MGEENAQTWENIWELVQKYHEGLLQYAIISFGSFSEDSAHDLVHDFWMQIGPALSEKFDKISSGHSDKQVLAYITARFRWFVLSRYSKRKRRQELLTRLNAETWFSTTQKTPEDAAYLKEFAQELERAVSSLDSEYRQLYYRLVDEYSPEAIAEEQNVAVSTIYRKKRRLVGHLKTLLEQKDVK